MDEYGVSKLLDSHLREARGAYTVDAVSTHQRIILSHHRSARSTWRWNAAGDDLGFVAIIISTSGTLSLTSPDITGRARPPGTHANGGRPTTGAVAVASIHRATLWFGGKDASCAIIWLPAKLLSDAGINLSTPLLLSSTMMLDLLRVAITMSLRRHRTVRLSSHEHQIIERVLFSLAFGVILEEHAERPAAEVGSHLEKAHSIMLAKLADPRFDVAALAEEMNLSRRQLQRLFNQFDTTPGRALRALRIDVAMRLINDETRRYTKQQIASRSGFKSVAALRRALESVELSPNAAFAEPDDTFGHP